MNQTIAPSIIPTPAMIEGWIAIEKPSDFDRRVERLRRGDLLGRSGGAGATSGPEGRGEKASSDVAVLAGLRAETGLSGAFPAGLYASFLTSRESSGRGTATIAAHAGQRNFRPADSSLTRTDRPQAQVTGIDI